MSSEITFCFGRISGFGVVFLVVMNWFNKVSKVFLGQNELKMRFWVKKQRSQFFRPPQWLSFEFPRGRVIF
jgi:hypothetical protein